MIAVPTFKQVLGVTAQGGPVTDSIVRTYVDGSSEYVIDPLRLLRATSALIVPTRNVIRLLATAEDVTHS